MSDTTGAALSAIYDAWADADAARTRLAAAGIPQSDVRVIPESPEVQAEGQDVGTQGGFLGALLSMAFPHEENPAYEEAIRRGGVLLVVERVPPSLREAAEAAIDVDGAVDLDERQSAWTAEGWAGGTRSGATGPTLRRDARRRGRIRSYASE